VSHQAPWSPEAEQSVLGALLLDNSAFDRVRGLLKGESFFDHRHAVIWQALAGLLISGQPADVVTVFDALSADAREDVGGLAYLVQLAEGAPSVTNVLQYAEIVRERALRRELLATADAIRSLAENAADVGQAVSEAQAAVALVSSATATASAPRPCTLDLRALAQRTAPAREWFIPGWLGPGPSLFAAGGGIGKTLMAQQVATAGALGRSFVGDVSRPFRSQLWACEDDADELWRRQEAICVQMGVPLDAAADDLIVQSRLGVDSMLMALDHGSLRRTAAFEELRQQVNDLGVDVLWLDNVAHLFGGDEVNRGQVTAFINSMAGLVTGRPFAVVLLAHTARQAGSEFAGSAAWENAVRMRWYLGTKLPDQKGDADDEGQSDARFLCKRKANYSSRDYLRFTMQGGVLVPDQLAGDHIGGMVSQLDEQRAEEIVLAGFRSLQGMGIAATDAKNSPDFLPRQMAAKGLAAGYSVPELTRAMNRLMGSGKFVRGVVGHYSNRNPKQGLVLQQQEAA
jgi:hypothetical protein